jgi:ketosteroid isomerase-like protein
MSASDLRSDSLQLDFIDSRTPYAILATFERDIRTAFSPTINDDKLSFQGQASFGCIQYAFELIFKAARPEHNHFHFAMKASWNSLPDSYQDYCRKTVASWFALWTSDFTPSHEGSEILNDEHRYRLLCDEVAAALQQIATIPLIQQVIVSSMKRGAFFSTSHKEGGSRIVWHTDHFIRTDIGDNPDVKRFAFESDFLDMLYRFYHTDATCSSTQLPELIIWRLILRQLRFPDTA